MLNAKFKLHLSHKSECVQSTWNTKDNKQLCNICILCTIIPYDWKTFL